MQISKQKGLCEEACGLYCEMSYHILSAIPNIAGFIIFTFPNSKAFFFLTGLVYAICRPSNFSEHAMCLVASAVN